MRQLTPEEVTFTLEVEPEWEIAIIGNCSAISKEIDRETAEWIGEQIEAGNEWAWCYVIVRAQWEGFEGMDSLGGCSYMSEEEFTAPGGYYEDMKQQALDDLNRIIAETSSRLEILAA